MKKSLLAAAVILFAALSSTTLWAWGGRSGSCCEGYNEEGKSRRGFRGFNRLEYLKEEIGLSDEQIKQIIDINSEYRYKYYINRKDEAKIDELRVEHEKEINSVLTDDQRKKLDEDKNSRFGRGRGFFRGRCYN